MKQKIQRMIKVLSCFIVISAVILASVAVPGHAVNGTVYTLGQVYEDTVERDGMKKVSYDFSKLGISPRVLLWKSHVSDGFSFEYVFPDQSYSTLDLEYVFLGSSSGYSSLLDITDTQGFDRLSFNSQLRVKSNFSITGNNYVRVNVFYSFSCLNSAGKYISSVTTSKQSFYFRSGEIQSVLDASGIASFPEGTVYVLPHLDVSVYSPNGFTPGNAFEFTLERNELVASKWTFIGSVNDAFDAVIGWVGTVFSSLVGGSGPLRALLPLLAVGVSVSVLFLGIKAIRHFIWGS